MIDNLDAGVVILDKSARADNGHIGYKVCQGGN
jgi:hypothetical protein